jgi:uncharacterized protein (TIGR00369 family)
MVDIRFDKPNGTQAEEENFYERVKNIQYAASRGFISHVGAELVELRFGHCTIAVAKRTELSQQLGYFHGGVSGLLVDASSTLAASTIVRPSQTTLTAEFKINYLAPAAGDRLICRARVVKPGRTLVVVASDVFCVTDGVEKQTAIALASIAIADMPKTG